MSLLGTKKFWKTKLSLRTRLCYLSGFLYYINTAVFAFVIPLLSIALLAFDPGILQLKNLIFFAPILIYSGVIYPMWHRVPYRLEAWSVREISGLGAHLRDHRHHARQAARMAAVGQQQDQAGRPEAVLGRPRSAGASARPWCGRAWRCGAC